MNLSTQLRIILLLVGAAIWLAIYLIGKRKSEARQRPVEPDISESLTADTSVFTATDELDEEALETPAYMRRQGQREARQDYDPRIANADDYVANDYVGVADRRDVEAPLAAYEHAAAQFDMRAESSHVSAYAESVYARPGDVPPVQEPALHVDDLSFDSRREPTVSMDEGLIDTMVDERAHRVSPVGDAPQFNMSPQISVVASPQLNVIEPPTIPSIRPEVPVVAQSVTPAATSSLRSTDVAANVAATPTLSEIARPAAEPRSATHIGAPEPRAAAPAPTAERKPAGNESARRKIVALRLPMPERVPGTQLLSLLHSERLQHGKFSIFHRMHESGTVFSVASMVEPGTFDPKVMDEQQFPGVTIFMLLPGPLDGLVAYDQMLSCAQRLAHATGGILQDERGSKLTALTMDRLREEVLDFQHLLGGAVAAH